MVYFCRHLFSLCCDEYVHARPRSQSCCPFVPGLNYLSIYLSLVLSLSSNKMVIKRSTAKKKKKIKGATRPRHRQRQRPHGSRCGGLPRLHRLRRHNVRRVPPNRPRPLRPSEAGPGLPSRPDGARPTRQGVSGNGDETPDGVPVRIYHCIVVVSVIFRSL